MDIHFSGDEQHQVEVRESLEAVPVSVLLHIFLEIFSVGGHLSVEFWEVMIFNYRKVVILWLTVVDFDQKELNGHLFGGLSLQKNARDESFIVSVSDFDVGLALLDRIEDIISDHCHGGVFHHIDFRKYVLRSFLG